MWCCPNKCCLFYGEGFYHHRFCHNCGVKLVNITDKCVCGNKIEKQYNFCTSCGKKIVKQIKGD